MAALQMKQQGYAKKVLCCVLAPLRTQWAEEIEKFTSEKAVVFSDFKSKYSKRKGKKPKVVQTAEQAKQLFIDNFIASGPMFLICSYQGLQQNQALFEKCEFDLIIFDEAHFINNKLNKTNKAATRLIQKRSKRHKKGYNRGVQHIIYASGTAITNYPDQIFGIVRTGNDQIFGNWRDFQEQYCELNDYKDIVGYKYLDKLRRKCQRFFIRRTDKEIGLSLPQKVEKNIIVDPHPKQLKMDKELLKYQKELVDAMISCLKNGMKDEAQMQKDRLKSILTFRRAASNHPNLCQKSDKENVRERYAEYAVKDIYDIPKFEKCIELVQEIVDGGHKVVIFTQSRRMTGMLAKEISQFTKVVRYIGGLTDKQRDARKKKFNHDPSVKVMVANQAGATGLNLQAGRYLINYDLPDTPAEWEQRKYRIRRLDSTFDKIYIINLIVRGLVDEAILAKLDNKQAAFDFILENDEGQTKAHQTMVKKGGKTR